MLRTHTCGELREKDVSKSVVLAGWVQSVRGHGAKAFIDVRDRYGITQVVCENLAEPDPLSLRRETVIQIAGTVRKKPEANAKLVTGEIEVAATRINVLGPAEVLPFDETTATEETRMKHRYLDLRNPRLQEHLLLRHKAAMAAREHLSSEGFLEIETPLLVRATPEGARDFLVPSRINKGQFYALPQSPQIYKQLLMVSGLDRYFQLAKCLRDEDLRADRQPEFTQIDVEMSFPELEDIYALGDRLVQHILKKSNDVDVQIPFPRIPYAKAMEKYGIDKPDLRFGLELSTVTDVAKKGQFKIFNEAETVRTIVVPRQFGRKEIDAMTEHVKVYKAKGLAYLEMKDGKFDGPMAKFFSADVLAELAKTLRMKDGESVFFVADKKKVANEALAQLRNKLGKDLELYDPREFRFCWVTEFPLFEWDEEEKRWAAAHHMFTMPTKETLQLLESDPGKVIASCYDIVLNGVELASGSIRIHDSQIQKRVMAAMNIKEAEARKKFGFLLDAFTYGAPPHGGFAIGFDRIVALMAGESDIREFIAFPKNKSMQGMMDGSPNDVDAKQLDELGIVITKEPATKQLVCQSCGMPLRSADDHGTNKDGGRNEEYCRYCFAQGTFTLNVAYEQFVEHQVSVATKKLGVSEQQARAMAQKLLSLKRWKSKA